MTEVQLKPVLPGTPSGDVSQVQLWYDAPNNGIFNPGTDVLVGTGAFGNYQGNSFTAQINMFTPVTILPTLSNRYFVAYVMSPTAQPTDPTNHWPRTLGAIISAASLPTNNTVNDNPFQNARNAPLAELSTLLL